MKNSIRPQVCAQKLHALAAPDRLRSLCSLRERARNLTEIAELLGTTLVNVSHLSAAVQGLGAEPQA